MAYRAAPVAARVVEPTPCPPQHVSDPLPWLAVAACWLCFGSFAVPMKWAPVLKADVHPLVYQTYKTFWTFVTSHLVLVYQPFELSYWGLVSGVSWVPAGVFAVVAVRHIGVACGQAVWQVTIILTSFVWGFFILDDSDVHTLWGTLLSIGALCTGVVGMTLAISWKRVPATSAINGRGLLAASAAEDAYEAPRPNSGSDVGTNSAAVVPQLGHRRSHCTPPSDGEVSSATPPCENGSQQQPGVVRQSTALGIAAALFNGMWGGANLVPSHYAPLKGVHFTLSFAWGSMVVNICMLLGYQLLRLCTKRQVVSLHFRVMAVPGFISGTLWSTGNFFALYVVQHLGQGIGNSCVQMNLAVAGLWGICYYRELAGHRICVWLLFVTIAMCGVVGLALERKSPCP
mmetsp:Transcript_65873/g.122955  ORF Transcript_65873/g.122955 Transcript_65873/m.122955 type:complete len:401 (-) Transcript_65873:162-1364(-)